jgi:quercetin dioxygenase-like cupin family protein
MVHRLGVRRHHCSPDRASRLSASTVHFTLAARTAWHTHPNGQHVTGIEYTAAGSIEEAK